MNNTGIEVLQERIDLIQDSLEQYQKRHERESQSLYKTQAQITSSEDLIKELQDGIEVLKNSE